MEAMSLPSFPWDSPWRSLANRRSHPFLTFSYITSCPTGTIASVYPDFAYTTDEVEEATTLPPDKQRLRLSLSKKQRGGKEVSLITGFIGTTEDLEALGKLLRQRCGVGGSAKDGEILVQGDQREKLHKILLELGYRQTK